MKPTRKPQNIKRPWTHAELTTLKRDYPLHGSDVPDLRGSRSPGAIHVKANKLGIKRIGAGEGRHLKLAGQDLELAIQLRQQDKWSYQRIGERFGIAETSASNAILMALCVRSGYTPAQRHPNGRLTDEGLSRLRYALRKGLKGVDITLRLGVSAACVAEQRRRYSKELKGNRKAPLPLHGNNEHYSGRKLTTAERRQVEDLFKLGYGGPKISEMTGISKTSCQRVRKKLIAKLARKNTDLTGCNRKGARSRVKHSTAMIPEQSKAILKALILDRIPVARAAAISGVGASSAYKFRDELAYSLEANGEQLQRPILPGRVKTCSLQQPDWPPKGKPEFIAFRKLLDTLAFEDAKAEFILSKTQARKIDMARPRTFEETLKMVGEGKLRLTPSFSRWHLEPMIPQSQKPHDSRPQPAHS